MSEQGRAQHDFPSRQYSYGRGSGAAFADPEAVLDSGGVFRFICGRDRKPAAVAPEEGRGLLRDPFAQLILFSGAAHPLSLRGVLRQLDSLNGDVTKAFPEQRSFVVADGGQIPWTPETNDLHREFRIVITRKRVGSPEADVLISASTNFDSETAFLQVIAWDPGQQAFQFYERRRKAWVWAGNSWDALEPDARGKGPFDSHVNGALNMKELKQPWVNWHSQSASIRDTALAPDDPLRTEALWTGRSPAEDFEVEVARSGIQRWTDARFARATRDGRLQQLPGFMRQVLETTTVNLVSSPVSKARLATAQQIPLPLTFFLNSDALVNVIGLEPAITVPVVPTAIYREMLRRFDVAITDGTHRFAGDTHFVFVVPEPAFEDVVVLERLITLGVLSRRLAACLLMVDFPNAVFSPRRASLLQYTPELAATGNPAAFEQAFIAAIRGSAGSAASGSVEGELLANWQISETQWEREFEQRIERFFASLAPRFATAEGFAGIFELAESRRREFRKRKLAEFRLTTPITNIAENASFLEFTTGGDIRKKS